MAMYFGYLFPEAYENEKQYFDKVEDNRKIMEHNEVKKFNEERSEFKIMRNDRNYDTATECPREKEKTISEWLVDLAGILRVNYDLADSIKAVVAGDKGVERLKL